MSDATVTITTGTAAGENEAIPVTETATPVTQTTPTDTTTSIPETSSDTSSITSSETPTTLTTSSTSSTAVFNPFTEPPPFFSSGALPPWASNSGNPFTNPFRDQTSNGLSTGAKAGIGVGVAALMISIVAVALLILRMRKKEQALQSHAIAPPPYESPTHSNIDLVKVPPAVPPKSEKRAPPPPPLNLYPEPSHGSSLQAPIAIKAKDIRRKSNKSLRPRRNSNLAPVSEEETEEGESRLALVSEGEILPSPAPSTPKTPRTAALFRLNGEPAVPSPVGSHFMLGANLSFGEGSGNGSPSSWDEKRPHQPGRNDS